ncbi:cobalt ECF transporter T component CbiQ [Thermodesulfatator atlanticus]
MKESFLRRRDPRVKLLLALDFAIIVAVSNSFKLLFLAGIFSVICLGLSGFAVGYVLRRLGLVNLFLVLVVLTLPFTTQGELLFKIGPFSAAHEGTLLALMIFLKSNLIVLTTMALLSTSTVFELAHALHHLYLPSKLVQLLFFTFRYLNVVEKEYRRLREAALLRGFYPHTNLFTYRTTAYLVGSLIVRSYDRSQRVYEAMLCRGFEGTFPIYRHFQLERLDIMLGLLGATYLALMAILG